MTRTTTATSLESPPIATIKRLAGKRVAMVTFSSYPFDPRPRRSIDALLAEGATVDLICLGNKNDAKGEVPVGVKVFPRSTETSSSWEIRICDSVWDVHPHFIPDLCPSITGPPL